MLMNVFEPRLELGLAALIGLLLGVLVAEVFYHKAARHAKHVVPATIVNESAHVIQQKLWYYGLFLTFVFSEYILKIKIPDVCYYLVVFAIAGGDLQKLANRFFRLK